MYYKVNANRPLQPNTLVAYFNKLDNTMVAIFHCGCIFYF